MNARTIARSRLLAATAAASASTAFGRKASAAGFEYKLATVLPADYSATVRAVQMCEAIKTETRGRLQITVFPNSVLGSQASLIAQLRLGSIQFMSDSVYSSVVPAHQVINLGFAYPSSKVAFDAMSGPLGDYIRREFAAKGLYAFERGWDAGFRQVTSSTHPIRVADDFAGFKIRTQPTPIFVDLFRTLGASPVPLDANELYTALQTHVADGAENPLPVIESFKMFEVQKYISLTNHIWSNTWLVANGEAWNALPADLQSVVKKSANKYVALQRNDSALLTASLTDKLRRQGITFNECERAGMRARLGPYYAHWRTEFGPTLWNLLEGAVGKLT